jgi:eukaryotic-like serine/threonine-protein kinase
VKTSFLKSDWFIALSLSILLLLLSGSNFIQAIERKAYDIGIQATQRDPGDDIAIIAIDDQSIKNIGRWPWSRSVHATIIDQLKSAKVVGNTVFFLEPQVDQGLAYINKIDDYLNQSSISKTKDGVALSKFISKAKSELDTDAQLANSIKNARNVVLGMPFVLGAPRGNPENTLPDYITKFSVKHIIQSKDTTKAELSTTLAKAAIPPIASIAESAIAIGHLNSKPDIDGAIRVEPLVLKYYDEYYPSLSLQIAAKFLNLTSNDIQLILGKGVKLGQLNIATDASIQMNSFFYSGHKGHTPFTVDSFYDVYSGKIPAEKYLGKIVLIGMAATGASGDMQVTPISASMPPIETLAHNVASILNENFFISPSWALAAELTAWLGVSIYLIFLLPKLSASNSTWISIAIAMTLLFLHFALMTQSGLWVQLMMPILLLILGHALIGTKRYLMTERGKVKSDAESSESNRNLALMLQSQGQLDMAFDRFRKCKIDDALMDNLFNLGLDFERKRQFNKAEAVFSYIAKHNPHYQDLKQHLASSRQLSETMILGGNFSNSTHQTLLLTDDEAVEKPMLGRYKLEKILGKGAMGTVYLGIDIKIGRQVAIKTLALAREFEAHELDAVKSRFFREAETAGRLNHPNIVTIYDAGEEHDLAYIAMELLKGHDLNKHIKKDQLLPIPTLLKIMIKVAEALNYAHEQHVIHRDIKPANIMFEPETDSVKVTDFGIARITDASKTKTGMILGTPNFMSPEQLSGKMLDGRSDLFSLGATLYQLVTGQLPFAGDSMANLMYNISNETQTDIMTINPNLPSSLSMIINKLLEKDVNKRYPNGNALAHDLQQCITSLKS